MYSVRVWDGPTAPHLPLTSYDHIGRIIDIVQRDP